MSQPAKPSLVGSIVERKAVSHSPPTVKASKTGFPVVQHRSKSAFARTRNDLKKPQESSKLQQPPTVRPAVTHDVDRVEDEAVTANVIAQASDDWMRQMEEENQRRVEGMSPEELEAARREIFEHFGPEIAETLRQSRARREAAGEVTDPLRGGTVPAKLRIDPKALKSALASRAASPVPLSASSTRPSSRTDRQIRFAELTPKDVYVYESAPSSPPKKALALPAPTEADGPTVSLGQWHGRMASDEHDLTEDDSAPSRRSERENAEIVEGTPEDIRRRFFPEHPSKDPSLAWIEASDNSEASVSTASALRFDLSGTPIPPDLSETLPTHLGLHHHAEGNHAGYTLEDIFLLSRSTVPAQRASMFGILASIAMKIRQRRIEELVGQEIQLRKRMLAAGVEAFGEKGSVGIRAVEVVWSCVVAWDAEPTTTDGIELKSASDDTLDTLPLEFILKQITDAFGSATLPPESLIHLLEVVHRLAADSTDAASAIVDTSQLIPNLLRRFLLIQPSNEPSNLPNPTAIRTLVTLAQASRMNALAVADSAALLLRFVVILPEPSPYPLPLATSLLISTLDLYRVLASYGLCSQLATTASQPFDMLFKYLLSDACTSEALMHAWLGLLEAWMVCAVDPHRTTPDHDILWSQIVGWDWGNDILQTPHRLSAMNLRGWTTLWRTEAAWLEGSSINSIKGGEAEKAAVAAAVGADFEDGVARQLVEDAARNLASSLSSLTPDDALQASTWTKVAQSSELLASAIRLFLSCLPSQTPSSEDSLPFPLPFSQISAVCAQLTAHPLWTAIHTTKVPRAAHAASRSLSLLLSTYLRLSRISPGVPPALWMAQAFSIICRLSLGDEDHATLILSSLAKVITPENTQSLGLHVSPAIWEAGGLSAILPLLIHSVQRASVRVGPLWMSPGSLTTSETLRLPSLAAKGKNALPLPRDWMFFPLDHLLRSGDSDAIKSLPSSWDFSETEVARATLLLAKIHRHVLQLYHLDTFSLTREETVFSCMKVFMLEHEQQQATSVQEVFRDSVVGELVEDLLSPFTVSASTSRTSSATRPLSLEEVAKGFLGEGTPFYQYYTDFVALYDSVSFSHPLFARLLLPPLSMRYPSDYRKYLWADYNHVLRTIRIPMESVVAQGVEEYLWPLETNAEVLTAYLRALVKGQVEGFMRFIAIHHIACSIWPDLHPSEDKDERAVKLLQAIAGQANFDVVKDVVRYHQSRERLTYAPDCFDEVIDLRNGRRLFADLCGDEVRTRLAGLFE